MTNTGCHKEAAGAEALFVRNFSGYDYIVAPSGSCVHQVRVNMTAIEQTPDVLAVSTIALRNSCARFWCPALEASNSGRFEDSGPITVATLVCDVSIIVTQ
jgi:hypothetical protein